MYSFLFSCMLSCVEFCVGISTCAWNMCWNDYIEILLDLIFCKVCEFRDEIQALCLNLYRLKCVTRCSFRQETHKFLPPTVSVNKLITSSGILHIAATSVWSSAVGLIYHIIDGSALWESISISFSGWLPLFTSEAVWQIFMQ